MKISESADLILTNGKIATHDPRSPLASAVAIKDGKFVAVGDEKEVAPWKGNKTQVIELGKRTVIPGLNDSHLHLIRGEPDPIVDDGAHLPHPAVVVSEWLTISTRSNPACAACRRVHAAVDMLAARNSRTNSGAWIGFNSATDFSAIQSRTVPSKETCPRSSLAATYSSTTECSGGAPRRPLSAVLANRKLWASTLVSEAVSTCPLSMALTTPSAWSSASVSLRNVLRFHAPA
jgi:hypothetical protein